MEGNGWRHSDLVAVAAAACGGGVGMSVQGNT